MSFHTKWWIINFELGNYLGSLFDNVTKTITSAELRFHLVCFCFFLKCVKWVFLRWFPGRRRHEGFLTGTRNQTGLQTFMVLLGSDWVLNLSTSDGLSDSWMLDTNPAIRQRRSELNPKGKKTEVVFVIFQW